MKTFQKDCLTVCQYGTRSEMGKAAAADVAAKIREMLSSKETIRMIFAAAPSQNEFLEALTADASIDFSRIDAFHMDEYIGLPADAPQGFGNFLRDRLFAKAPFRSVQYLNGLAADPEEECRRYGELLDGGVDIVCMGIGENGHIAFNDLSGLHPAEMPRRQALSGRRQRVASLILKRSMPDDSNWNNRNGKQPCHGFCQGHQLAG